MPTSIPTASIQIPADQTAAFDDVKLGHLSATDFRHMLELGGTPAQIWQIREVARAKDIPYLLIGIDDDQLDALPVHP